MKAFLASSVAVAAVALCISSASAALVYDGQINASFVAAAPDPTSSFDALPETTNFNGYSPFNNDTSPWLNIVQSDGTATFDATNTFSFVWGSPSDNNIVTLNGPTPVSYTTADLLAIEPSVVNRADTYGYLVTVTGDFSSVTLSQTTGGNFEVGFGSAVPEASTWAMMGLGFAGLAFAGYRSRRTAVSIA
jgi:hypothetical protein